MTTPPDNRLLTVFTKFPRFDLIPSQTALIVVDMQYLDAHPDFGIGRTANEANATEMFAQYWPAVRNAVDKQKAVIEAAPRTGVQGIFTRIATQPRDARDVGRQHSLVGLPLPRDSQEACLLD